MACATKPFPIRKNVQMRGNITVNAERITILLDWKLLHFMLANNIHSNKNLKKIMQKGNMSNPADRDQSRFSIKRVEYNNQMLLQHNISTVYNASLGKYLNSSN